MVGLEAPLVKEHEGDQANGGGGEAAPDCVEGDGGGFFQGVAEIPVEREGKATQVICFSSPRFMQAS